MASDQCKILFEKIKTKHRHFIKSWRKSTELILVNRNNKEQEFLKKDTNISWKYKWLSSHIYNLR